MSKSGFFMNDRKSKISLIVKQRFENTSSRPIMTEEVFKNGMKLSSFKRRILSCSSRRRTTSTRSTTSSWAIIGTKSGFSRSSWEKSQWDERIEAISRFYIRHNFEEMVEDRDTVLELTGKIQELPNEINCMNDSRDFQDAESVRSGQSHVTSQPVSFPPHPDPGGKLSRSLGMPQKWAAKYLGHTWYIGKRFCKSNSVFFSTFSARVEPMNL